MDARRLVLGDWTPVVRDGIDVLRLVILGGALAYAVAGLPGAASLLAALGVAAVTITIRQIGPSSAEYSSPNPHCSSLRTLAVHWR